MLAVDLAIVVVGIGMAAWGFRRKLTLGMLVAAAFAAGAVLGSRLAPLVLEDGLRSTHAPTLALPGALLGGAMAAAALERRRYPVHRWVRRLASRRAVAGAIVACCLALVAAWTLAAVLAQIDALDDAVEESAVLDGLNAVLPVPGPILAAEPPRLAPVPRYEGPDPRVARADPRIARDPDVQAAARRVGRVTVIGCGRAGLGSGWAAGEGLIVTASHVVTGADAVTVRLRRPNALAHPATIVWLDRENDLAVLRVSALARVAGLPLVRDPKRGTAAAMLGFPGGSWAVGAARLGPTTVGRLRYGRRTIVRRVTLFRGRGRTGYSGGPLVDGRGRVLTTLYAGNAAGTSGVGVANSVVASALARAGPPVGSGPCDDPYT